MGQRDRLEWRSKRDPGCTCDYCNAGMHINFETEFTDKVGVLHIVRELDDGTVQISTPRFGAPGKVRYLISPVGCLVSGAGMKVGNPTDCSKAIYATADKKASPKTGYNCFVCNERNEYAAANTGTRYLCYKCRT